MASDLENRRLLGPLTRFGNGGSSGSRAQHLTSAMTGSGTSRMQTSVQLGVDSCTDGSRKHSSWCTRTTLTRSPPNSPLTLMPPAGSAGDRDVQAGGIGFQSDLGQCRCYPPVVARVDIAPTGAGQRQAGRTGTRSALPLSTALLASGYASVRQEQTLERAWGLPKRSAGAAT
jgi:hypothetical protein